ncbi:MAG: nucleotide sugar dehydrogenase [Bdellovibrionales bacterium]|nr:nucleotide sugar dehydrogenase [Bdellovibrionales bacterium]
MPNRARRIQSKSHKEDLLRKIWDKSAVSCVVGLGYVGLPLAIEQARAGFKVVGVDTNEFRAKMVQSGKSYLHDIPAESFQSLLKDKLSATASYENLPEVDIFIVTVPTPLSKSLSPDLSFLHRACEQIATILKPGQLVCIESTTYPGTTEQELLPILEKSGLKVEEDFFLAYSPERVDPGNKKFTVKNTPKVVGGLGTESLEIAVAYYSQFIDTIVSVSSAWVAEMVKIYENTYRSVNIALVNEMAMLSKEMGLNIWEILDAAFSKPFGILPFYPGPGVGGHCIPLDPHYLEWKARAINFNTEFITLAGKINRHMPSYVVGRLRELLDRAGNALSQSRILVLGVAYKKDADESREAPALDIITKLQAARADVSYYDSRIPEVLHLEQPLRSIELTPKNIQTFDAIVITNEDSNVDYSAVVTNGKIVFDTRNATRGVKAHRHKITLL